MRRSISSLFMTLILVTAVSMSAVGQSESLSLEERTSRLGKLASAVNAARPVPDAVEPEEQLGNRFMVGQRFIPSRFGFKAGALIGGAIGCLSAIEGWRAGASGTMFESLTSYSSYRQVTRDGLIGAAIGGLSGFLFGELVEVVSRRR